MTKRWTQRPEGSTWGDWGDDDELGRINLLTPEKVLEGVREVQAGISFCLSLPLDFPGGTILNQRRHPPGRRPHRGHGGQRGHLLQRPHERDAGLRRPQVRRRLGRRRGHALAAVLDPVGLARPRRRRVRRRRRRGRGGRLLQRLPGRCRTWSARLPTPWRRCGPPLVRPPPRPRAHGVPRRAGPRRAGRPRRTTWATSGGASTWRRCRRSWTPTGSSWSPATCCCCTRGSRRGSWSGTGRPTRGRSSRPARTSTPRTRRCSSGSPRRRSRRWWPTTTRSRACSGKDRDPEPALLPADPPPVPVQARRAAGRAVVPPRAGGLAAGERPLAVPAHGPAAAPAGHRRLPADADRHGLTVASRARPPGQRV